MTNFGKRVFWKIYSFGWLDHLSDKTFLKLCYRVRSDKKLHLNNPVLFSEKMQWLKIYDRKPIYTQMSDKYGARKFVADRIGDEYLVELYGVWDDFDSIDFDSLPDSFVLKCTHDSGGLCICRDKSKFNIARAKAKINSSLNRNYYYHCREWPYKDIKPRIIAERFLEDNIKDYKFYCFNGEVKYLYVSQGLENHSTANISFYDLNFNQMPFYRSDYKPFDHKIDKPLNFEKMIELAAVLAKDLPFIRVDFYDVDGKIYFSELTFYPCSGFIPFEPPEWDEKMGNMLELPINK